MLIMASSYSANPNHINVDLQSPAVGLQMWLAGSLISFTAVYIALSSWLSWYALHLLFGLNADQTSLFTLVAGASSGFLGMFMARTLVRLPLYIFRSCFNAR
jgi:predicted permease